MATPGHSKENGEEPRRKFKKYWEQFEPNLESMMLSDNASLLTQTEQMEIMDYIPNYKGKDVLELGAGIGRFTTLLAEDAKRLTAVDFMESYINTNQKINSKFTNIEYECADVTKQDYPAESFDLVFTNWLFMYLTDAEVLDAFKKIARWLKPGGHFFIRESCYHPSGNKKRNENPTHYRTPLEYIEMIQNVQQAGNNFILQRAKSVHTYVKYSNNPNQLIFVMQKTSGEVRDAALGVDPSQSSIPSILSHERIYGNTWLTPGGESLTRELVPHLKLKLNSRVLNVGCRTGGEAMFIARHYGANIHGIDLSGNMIHLAIGRQGALQELRVKNMIQYELCDIRVNQLEEEAYDAIYCRDVMSHCPDKTQVFRNMLNSLKDGGRLVMTDFCLGERDPTIEFTEYTNKRNYSLTSANYYKKVLDSLGFDVTINDGSDLILDICKKELMCFIPTKEAFIKEFSEERFDSIVYDWTQKIKYIKENMMTMAIITATK